MSLKRPAAASSYKDHGRIDATKAAKNDDAVIFVESSKTCAFVDMNGVIYSTPRPWMIQPWVKVVHPDYDGRIHYFYNEVTSESVWEDPIVPHGTAR